MDAILRAVDSQRHGSAMFVDLAQRLPAISRFLVQKLS